MKSFELLRVLALFILAVDLSAASLLAFGRTRPKKVNDRKTTEAPHVCLDSPINLPACNFRHELFEQLERSAKHKRALEYFAASDLPQNPQELTLQEDDPRKKYTRALTIVYKIEGCIPSRLPFDIPICRSKDVNERIIEVRRLFPFKVMGDSEQDPGVPFVFPEFDYHKWRSFMKGAWTRPIKDDEDVEKSSPETFNDSESESEMRKIPKRKKFGDSNNLRNKRGKLSDVVWSKKMAEHDLPSMSIVPEDEVMRYRNSDETNAYNIRTNKMNRVVDGETRNDENVEGYEDEHIHEEFPYEEAIAYNPEKLLASWRESRFAYLRGQSNDPEKVVFVRLGSEFPYARAIPYDPAKLQAARRAAEFPYARAIPYDPAKLQAARLAAEFPYAQAIPYDPKKLEAKKKRAIERPIPFHTRRLKVVEETREEDFREVPFDTSMLAAAKLGSTFPYSKDVPEDTSKTLETAKLPNSKEPEKVRVPVRRVLELSTSQDFPNVEETLEFTKEPTNIRHGQPPNQFDRAHDHEPQEDRASRSNDQVSLMIPRVVRGTIESSTNDLSSISDNYEIPSPWSEFPYAKAIPFDPAKLRHQRSIHQDNSVITIPRIFPYARAIPYDPWKLTAFERNKQSIDQSFNPIGRDTFSRD